MLISHATIDARLWSLRLLSFSIIVVVVTIPVSIPVSINADRSEEFFEESSFASCGLLRTSMNLPQDPRESSSLSSKESSKHSSPNLFVDSLASFCSVCGRGVDVDVGSVVRDALRIRQHLNSVVEGVGLGGERGEEVEKKELEEEEKGWMMGDGVESSCSEDLSKMGDIVGDCRKDDEGPHRFDNGVESSCFEDSSETGDIGGDCRKDDEGRSRRFDGGVCRSEEDRRRL